MKGLVPSFGLRGDGIGGWERGRENLKIEEPAGVEEWHPVLDEGIEEEQEGDE